MLHPTPIMGWNSYNTFECEPNEEIIREMADAMVSSGLRDAGYTYINIDDGWMQEERENGHLVPNKSFFPSGLRSLTDYVHAQGLKIGSYLGCGIRTWNDKAGSLGYEGTDAQDLADWGFDFLKYDSRILPKEEPHGGRLRDFRYDYLRMAAAIQKTGRDIVLSICEHGETTPWQWGVGVGSMWRTGPDIRDRWGNEPTACLGFNEVADRHNAALSDYSRPGCFNDPDMLIVGLNGQSAFMGPGCTFVEYKAHFGLWCLMAAPLLIGADLRKLGSNMLNLLKHPGLIALDQDELCVQARRIHHYAGMDIYTRPLTGLRYAAGLYNRNGDSRKMTLNWEDMRVSNRVPLAATDLFTGEDLGVFTSELTMTVMPHELRILCLRTAF